MQCLRVMFEEGAGMSELRGLLHHRSANLIVISPARSLGISLGLALLAVGALSTTAMATTITTSLLPDFQAANLGANGTFRLLAFSEQKQSLNPVFSPAIGPNATQSVTTVLGG